MGVGRVLKFIFRRLLEILVIATILLLIPNLPPYANFSKPFKVTPAKPFTGKLELNNRLDGVEIWHQGDFIGPEAFADLNGELYTSLYTGDIVKLTGEHITPVVKFGKPCKERYEERICGRPLAIEFDQNGRLYATDAYYGIFRVNVKTGEKEQLVSPDTKVDGKNPKLFNSLVLARNGDIYWTDSTSDFLLEDGMYSMLADASGRLIHYDAKTKKNRILLDEIHFANGVALSEDEEFIIISETARSRLLRYYLKGPKKGTHDVFIDGLPGLSDNLRADGKGGFLVPLVLGRDADHPALYQSIGPFPLVRKAIARFMGVTEYIFKKVDELYPNEISLKVAHYIGHFTSAPESLNPKRVTLLRVNRNGEITDSVHAFDGKISGISEMFVFRDYLYLGSPFNNYIARVPLAKLGWEDLRKDERVKRAAPVETPKPTTTTPTPTTTTRPTTTTTRPTTTTPRPTTTTPRPTTTTPRPTTTTPKPTTTTPQPTTTTPKPTTTTPKPTTTTTRPTTTTPRPTTPPSTTQRTTTTQKPTTTTPKPTTTQKPVTTPPPPPKQQQTTVPPQAKQAPAPSKEGAPVKQTPPPSQQTKPTTPPSKQTPPPPVNKETPPQGKQGTPQAQKTPPPTQQQQKQAPPTKQQPKPAQGD